MGHVECRRSIDIDVHSCDHTLRYRHSMVTPRLRLSGLLRLQIDRCSALVLRHEGEQEDEDDHEQVAGEVERRPHLQRVVPRQRLHACELSERGTWRVSE